jgi:SEC-C motif-containing protein
MKISNFKALVELLLILCIHVVVASASTFTSMSMSISTATTSSSACFASPKKGKKNKKNKKNKNIVGAGFAQSSQPKLEQLEFKSRLPPNASEQPCPCGTSTSASGTSALYKDCCSPFHNKEVLPQSPIDVLKTRYTAFVYRLPLYVIETTHSSCRDFRKDKIAWAKDLNRSGMFDSYDFMNLNVVSEEIGDDANVGFIDFKVDLRANQNSGEHIEGQEIVVQEKSRFLRTSDGGWKYAGGDVTSNVAGLEGAILNN